MDIQKLVYDLSLMYTLFQYQKIEREGKIPKAFRHPQILEDSSFLVNTFTDIYIELASTPGLFDSLIEFENLEWWEQEPRDKT